MKQKILSSGEHPRLSDLICGDDFVLCFGHFDSIHPGHLSYLEYARTFSQRLVVAVESEQQLDLRGKKLNFTSQERAAGLAALTIVDFVITLDDCDLESFVKTLTPKWLVLGAEFKNERRNELGIVEEIIKKNNGSIVYHTVEVSYATDLLPLGSELKIFDGRYQDLKNICQRHGMSSKYLIDCLNKFRNARLLIVGDTIVDRFVTCDALGISSEAPVMVLREIGQKDFLGGAAIVAAHVAALGSASQYISVVGDDHNASLVEEFLLDYGVKADLVVDKSRDTTFKVRYMVEDQKILRVSRLNEHHLSDDIEKKVIDKIWAAAGSVDAIIVSDFVYGLVTENVVAELQQIKKRFGLRLIGDLQCSSQVGDVSKFSNFDLITPTEKEARLALKDRQSSVERIAVSLLQKTKTKNLMFKLGSNGFISYINASSDETRREYFPALNYKAIDAAGAGDALLAIASAGLACGTDLFASSVLGALGCDISVSRVGNAPISIDLLSSKLRQLRI